MAIDTKREGIFLLLPNNEAVTENRINLNLVGEMRRIKQKKVAKNDTEILNQAFF